jgi:hypothetical protein
MKIRKKENQSGWEECIQQCDSGFGILSHLCKFQTHSTLLKPEFHSLQNEENNDAFLKSLWDLSDIKHMELL